MRVTSLEVSGFRAFSGRTRFDLDGDVVLVVGANGQGKTSLFDAIHWAIIGEISRLQHPASIVSLYSASGEARVVVTIAPDDGGSIVVARHSDGQKDSLLVTQGGQTFRGPGAEHELLRRLWPGGLAASEPRVALRSALERGVYLQQDVVTDFLTADTDEERFNSIGELVGAGRATEFQAALERSRSAWSRATNQQQSETKAAAERLSRLDDQLRQLIEASSTVALSRDDWTAWWAQARHLGVSEFDLPTGDSHNADGALDVAMSELRAIQLSRERRGERLRELAAALREVPLPPFDLNSLGRTAEAATEALESARTTLAESQHRAAEARRRQVEMRSARQELQVLAELALRHLGEHCPVCQQTYDREGTRERLESLRRDMVEDADSPTDIPGLAEAAGRVQEMRNALSTAEAALQEAQRLERLRVDRTETIRSGLAELGINIPVDSDAVSVLESDLGENTRHLERLSAIRRRGDSLALALARAGQLARRVELEQEVQQVRRDLADAETALKARRGTGEMVSSMIDSLRDASSELVDGELRRLEPLLQRIYATADPHPEFRVVRLLSRMYRGRGRVLAEVEDPVHNHRRDAPSAFLSSSQTNVLAVSVFLALNLGLPTLPLRVAILDDPIQSLDDLNLLGLIDLLKRIRERRQLMVSTHDSRLGALLERKLRPVSDSQRTILVELSGWSSEGPVATQRDIARDPTRFALRWPRLREIRGPL